MAHLISQSVGSEWGGKNPNECLLSIAPGVITCVWVFTLGSGGKQMPDWHPLSLPHFYSLSSRLSGGCGWCPLPAADWAPWTGQSQRETHCQDDEHWLLLCRKSPVMLFHMHMRFYWDPSALLHHTNVISILGPRELKLWRSSCVSFSESKI